MMRCKEYKFTLPEYIAGELSGPALRGVEDHLALCDECRMELESLRLMLEQLPRLALTSPPESYWRSILPSLHARLDSALIPDWIPKVVAPLAGGVALIIAFIGILPHPLADRSETTDVMSLLEGMPYDLVQGVADGELEMDIIGITATSGAIADDQQQDQEVVNSLLEVDSTLSFLNVVDVESLVQSFDHQEITLLLASLK